VRQTQRSIPLVASMLVLSLGCSDSTAPGSQPPPTSPAPTAQSGYVWGFVIDAAGSGGCVHGAVVEIVDGPGTGGKSAQPDGCSKWDYSGGY
jgi:hypothetical protein